MIIHEILSKEELVSNVLQINITLTLDNRILWIIHVLWQSRGSREHGHYLLPVDLLQGAGSESEGMANRCDRQDAILPKAGK